MSRHDDVREFHKKYNHPVRETPHIPSDAEVRFRLRLITEEYLELLVAALPNTTSIELVCSGSAYSLKDMLQGLVRSETVNVDLPEFMDAITDLEYVTEGTKAVFGIDGRPIHDKVHTANMAKDPSGPDRKPIKPYDWKAPDVFGELVKQGWKG